MNPLFSYSYAVIKVSAPFISRHCFTFLCLWSPVFKRQEKRQVQHDFWEKDQNEGQEVKGRQKGIPVLSLSKMYGVIIFLNSS